MREDGWKERQERKKGKETSKSQYLLLHVPRFALGLLVFTYLYIAVCTYMHAQCT
jgi:hypothetical protein